MIRRLCSAVLALVIALGLTACRPEPVDPTPPTTPTPSPVVTPSPTVDEYEVLYEEAKQVYLRSVEVSKPFEELGQFDGFPAELEDLLADPYLQLSKDAYGLFEQEGIHALPGPEVSYSIAENRGISRDGSAVAIQMCQDSTGSTLVNSEGTVMSSGGIVHSILYFKHFGGRLKLFLSTPREVDVCPF